MSLLRQGGQTACCVNKNDEGIAGEGPPGDDPANPTKTLAAASSTCRNQQLQFRAVLGLFNVAHELAVVEVAPKMPTTPLASFAGLAAPSGFGGGAMTLQPGSSGVSGSLSCESCD